MAACFKGFVMATKKGDPVRRQKAELVFAGMRKGIITRYGVERVEWLAGVVGALWVLK